MQRLQSTVCFNDDIQIVDRIALAPSFLYFPSSNSLAADVVLLPNHLVKVQERKSLPRSKMDTSGKKPSPQDDNVYRGRSAAQHRSHSDVRVLERDSVKPVLILQNRSEPQKVDLNGRGKNFIGQKVAIGSHDRVFSPVSAPHPASMVRRSASGSPEMDRVRDWLHRNDFSQGLDGASEKRQTKRGPIIPDKNGVILTTSSAVASQNNPSQSPPPPPPPMPSTLPKNIERPQQHVDFHPKPIGQVAISPVTSSTPKLLFSSEIAAKRKSHVNQNAQQHPPDSETCRSPTTPSEKHLEKLVDSIFATALSGEITSPESTKTGRSYGQRRSLGAICVGELTTITPRSPPLEYPTSNEEMFGGRGRDHHDNGSYSTALMAELKGKLKAKGLEYNQSENYHGQQNDMGRTNDAVDSRVVLNIVNGGALPDVNRPYFQPLASSTPPPQPSTITPVPKSSTITPPLRSSTLSPHPLSIQEPTSPTPSFVFPPPPSPLPSAMLPPQPEFDRNTGDNRGQNVSLDINPTPGNFWRYDDPKSQSNIGLSHLVANDADGRWGTTSDPIQDTENGEIVNRYQLAEPECSSEQVLSRRSPDWPRGLSETVSRDVQTSPGLYPNRTSRVWLEAGHEGNSSGLPASFSEIPARSEGSWDDLHPENNLLHHRVQDDFGKISIEKINIAELLVSRESDHQPTALRESYCITNYNGLRDFSMLSEPVSSPVDSVYPPFHVSKFNSKGSNLKSYHGEGYFNERYDESTTWDTTAPDHVTGEQNARGGRGLNEGAVLPRLPGPALSCRNKQTHATGESRREIYDQSTHFSDYYLPTTRDVWEPFWSVGFQRGDIPPFVEQNKVRYEEYATAFRSGEDSQTIVTWLRRDNKTPDSKSHEDFRSLFDATVKSCEVYPNKGSNSHHSLNFDAFNQVSSDDFENDVAVSSYDKVGGFGYISREEEEGRNHAFTKVKFKESLNEDLPGWTSSSSSDSDKNLQRFTSAAISQKTFNTIFTHGAKLSLRARADRTLTGSHHNLILGVTRGFSSEDDSEDGVCRGRWSRQARSAPSSARKQKKKRSQSLSSRKHISESFFTFDSAANPAPTSETSQDNHDIDDPASPTTISIFSNNNGSKVVRIYRQRSKESSNSPVEITQGYNNTMLGSHNHDHELLPPSASGPSSGGKKNGSLVRSKSLFTSTPSLFTRTSPEEKFWKKELKKEKGAKKKFEEERKKVEKQEEKRRRKEEKKAATLGPAGVPKNWNQVSRSVENVYMRPGLRMTALPIQYMDYSRTSAFKTPTNQTGTPAAGHYATVNGPHIRGVSSVDYARVEQVYGTSHRRPVSSIQDHQQQQYTSHYGYTHNRQQLPRVILLHRSADGYGFVLRGAKSKLPVGGGFNDFSPTPEYPALQYLDSVDPGSQADRAGLKGGDFILEINGENVVRASHEHVVHLIRSSSDVLSMRVLTVTPSDLMPADWQNYQDSGAMTLPSRKKTAAPLPPQRDPRTSLSYSKGSSKSMTEGLAEIEKLDAAIAEFETLDDMHSNYYNSDDHKMMMMKANAMGVSDERYDGAYREEERSVSKVHMSPAEARIHKYHKTATSQALERSKSTPDIAGAIGDQYADHHHAGGHIGGSWTKKQAPAPPRHEVHAGISLAESGPYPPKNAAARTPNLPHRAPPGVKENSASAPHTPEFSRIMVRTENEKHRRAESQGTNIVSTYKNNQNGDRSISFADEKIMENANKFIQKYPNATLLVTADIHSNKLNGNKERVLYEPDPDYDSDDERSTSTRTSDTVHIYSRGRLNTSAAATDSNSAVRQNKSSVTIISINNDANRDRSKQALSSHSSPHLINSSKSSPKPVHVHDNVALTSPVQSLSSSRRSSGVVMATPSQPSSAESSRRSSIQSNYSGDAGDKSNKTYMISSVSAATISNSGRSLHEAEIPPPPPPPPPVLSGGKSTPPGGSANSTLRHRPNEMAAAGSLQSRVSTDDILAAVAERRNRLETEGPRFSEVKTLSTSKSTQEINHEALVAAVAKRKTRLEQVEDNTVVDDIESRLNRNKKLQAAKYFNKNVNRGSQDAGKDGQSGTSSLLPSASSGLKLDEQAEKNVATAAKEVARFDKPEPQAKQPTPVPLKSNKSEVVPSKTVEADNVGNVDFRARLKPVDVKGSVSNIAVHSKTSSSSSAASAPGTNVTTIVMSKAGSSKVGAPPAPPAPTTSTGPFPPPPPAASAAPPPPPPPAPIITSKPKTDLQATSNKTEPIKSPISPTSPNNNPSDYIALAEKARQEYLKKKASGNLQANIERKGPVEITPNRKNFPRGKTATTPASPTSPSDSDSLAQTKPAQETKKDISQVSVQDRIKTLQPNSKTVVSGVTEDHSHTELSLSNGTTRKPKSSISITPLQSVAPPSSKVAPPTLVHSNKSGNPSTGRGVALNIIPPPTLFGGTTGSPDSAFSQDDAASFASSASSHSTASSEHGGRQNKDFKDLLAHSPPPPPDFNNFSLGDQDAFIPPPPEFLEIDSNANESKRMDENSKPFSNKAASSWSCADVLDWLDSLGLPQYRIGFAKAGVDGPKLVNMGRNEFINLGVSQVGHRMSLERSVKKLNMGPSTNL